MSLRPSPRQQMQIQEVFAFFGFEAEYEAVANAQLDSWYWFFERNNFTDFPALFEQYRNLFYSQKVTDPYKLMIMFGRFIKENPTVASVFFEDRLKYVECDYCEGHGVVMIPVIGRDHIERPKAFRCCCAKGKIQFAGIPEPTEEMMEWRIRENRRENQKARVYLQGLGLDPDRCTFADMWKKLQTARGPMFTNVSDLSKPVPERKVAKKTDAVLNSTTEGAVAWSF
jgi:hypothetical protein